jgi:hypothetical protein
MAKRLGFTQVTNPEICFALEVSEKDEKRVIELANIGLAAWGNPEAVLEGEFVPDFTADDTEWIEQAGFCEPSLELLDRAGIQYKEIELSEVDSDTGHLIDRELEESISWNAA